MVSRTKTIAFVAALSAANAAFRVVLVGGPPNVKPTVFLTIIGGIIGGPLAGVAVGGLSMILSDLYFGAGIWTIETSAWMALVGLLAGLLWHKSTHLSAWTMGIGGFLITVVFDVGTSITDAVLFHYPVWASIVGLYVPFLIGGLSPYPFGFADELTTVILMSLIGPSLVSRIRKFYR